MPGRINAVVVGLVIEGLRRCAPHALPAEAELAALGGDDSGVPLEPYRAVLESVRVRAGGASLLQAGRALEQLEDPLLFVLLNSDCAQLLIEKEARLGRFIHSRHVVRILEQGEQILVLEHASLQPEPPQPGEDLAAAGQHITLFEQLGYQGVRLRLSESADPQRYVYRDGAYHEPAPGRYHVWAFEWDALQPTRRPMAGLDALLLSGESRPELIERSATVTAVEAVVRTDLGRSWTLSEIASRLGSSPRSLQRALAAESARFADLLDQIRVDEAQRLLLGSELSVTQIGYVCGFADTSHFSRRFKQRLGMPPSALRRSSS